MTTMLRCLITTAFLALLLTACAGSHPAPAAPAPAAPAPAPAAPAVLFDTHAFTVRVSGSGPPVVLIPGLACDGSVWDATAAHLAATHEVHVLTLAGFAGQPAIPAPFLATVRDELARYIRTRGLTRPILVGHSLGGFVAYWLALHEPELPGGVVAVDAVPYLAALGFYGATVEAMTPQAAKIRERLAAATPAEFAANNRQTLEQMITDPAEVERVAGPSAKSSPVAVADAVYEMLTTDLRAEVRKIRVPTLVMAAGTPDASHYAAQVATIPHHKVIGFPKAKHFIMLDAPAAFFAQLDAFVAEAEAEAEAAR